MNSSNRLDQYLDAFRQRLKRLTLLQGIAATAIVLLLVSVIGAWFSTESGFSGETVAAFRILLVLALAAVVITTILRPLRDLNDDISGKIESRTRDFSGRIETYSQMKESNNPFRDLLAEDALKISDAHPVDVEISRKEMNVSWAVTAITGAILLYLLIAGPGLMNYSLRNLFAGWAFDDLLPPQVVNVTPGDQSVRRSANLRVMAVMEGFDPDEAVIHVQTSAGQWQDVPMVQSPAGFEFTFFSLQENVNYYVSTTGMRSPEFTITVVDVPGIEALELTYNYPEWTERDPETFNTGDIRTLPDTRIGLKVTTTAPLNAGRLVLNEVGQEMALNGVDATAEFTVLDEGEYFIAAIVGGEQVRLSDDYFIRIAEDGKPVIEFVKPGTDWNASNIEEVTTRISASDDFNLQDVTLKYSVNGGDVQSVALAANVREANEEYIFMLEDMRSVVEAEVETNVGQFTIVTSDNPDTPDTPEENDRRQPPEAIASGGPGTTETQTVEEPLQPGDLISFYAEASDRTQTVRTDMFFIQVQSYARRYSQSQLSGGGGGGGGGPQDEISDRQRQIIVSTWNLIREQAEAGEGQDGQVRVNSSLLSELQTTLAEQAATLAERTRARQLSRDEQIEEFVQNMERAVQSMYPASEYLAEVALDDAIQPAQEALQHLLRAEAVFNDITLTQQQGGGGGGGGRAQQDLAEMFELEMDLELNQYETGDNVSPQAQQQEEEDIMSQLDELARRQEQLANNLRNQQQLTEAQRYQQEMLRRQTEELQERLEQLQQQRLQRNQTAGNQQQQGQQGQQGQQQGQSGQGQQGQSGEGQQGQTGENQQNGNNEQIAQSELQRRLESAIRAMNEAAEGMRGNMTPEELQQRAEEAQRQLEGAREQIAADQLADMQSSFANMADVGERMLREQQRMERVLQDAMAKAVEERESGEDPNSRGMELEEEWELAQQKQALAADLSALQEQMLSAMQRFTDDVPEASRELERANRQVVESELEQAISNAALYIDAGYGLYIAGNESQVTTEVRALAERLDEARALVESAGAPGNSDVDIARRQAQDLRNRMQQQLAGNGQSGDPNQQQQNGEQQQGGQQQGNNQQGGQQQGGQQGGNVAGGGADPFNGARGYRFGPWTGDDTLTNGPINLPNDFYGDLDQFTNIARRAVEDLELNSEELAQMYDWIRELEASRLNRNDAILAEEYNDMLALIEQLEVGLQLDSGSNNPNNVRTATSDVIPDEYKDSVAEYYRRLSRE